MHQALSFAIGIGEACQRPAFRIECPAHHVGAMVVICEAASSTDSLLNSSEGFRYNELSPGIAISQQTIDNMNAAAAAQKAQVAAAQPALRYRSPSSTS
jgi:hypothetical protein